MSKARTNSAGPDLRFEAKVQFAYWQMGQDVPIKLHPELTLRCQMAVPDFQRLMLPLLKLASDGSEHTSSDAIEQLANEFQLSEAERKELIPSGQQARLNNRVGWASSYLRKAGLLRTVRWGTFQITDRGRTVLQSNPPTIDLRFLTNHFAEVVRFRGEAAEDTPASFNEDESTWTLRQQVANRVRAKLESWIPDETTRHRALSAVAFAIEIADQERADAWCVRESSNGLRLMTGRLRACEITPSSARIAVVGPITEEVRAALGAELEDETALRSIPGGLVLTFPVERLGEQLDQLKDALSGFIGLAMARVRQAPGLEEHVPEAVEYIADSVGRELPQPEPAAEPSEAEPGDQGDEAEVTSHEPRIRGRAQIFERGERTIASLMDGIERNVIALPDLQRPFVWEDTKVRDLLDSLFLGFPVGTLVLWLTANEREARALGASDPALRATTLIIDGQQRLTSLYAVTRGQEVRGRDGKRRNITIAFRPRDGRFEVADAAIRSDPEYLPNVTELWDGKRSGAQIRRDLLNGLRDKGRAVDQTYEDAVERNLEIARSIEYYRFPTIDIRELTNDENAEEDVSEIFVRINNQGKRLGQADFVLTLLSVFHGELRDRIEERAREMSQDGLILVDAQQVLRAACGVAFDRARMSAVYRYLRGVDPKTGDTNPDARRKMLDRLDEAASGLSRPYSMA
jgi:hypothetical protein